MTAPICASPPLIRFRDAQHVGVEVEVLTRVDEGSTVLLLPSLATAKRTAGRSNKPLAGDATGGRKIVGRSAMMTATPSCRNHGSSDDAAKALFRTEPNR